MNTHIISAFAEELEKDAVAPALLQKLWRSGAGRVVAGAGAGAGVGALTDPENRARGALAGGLLGGIGGYASPLLTRAGRRAALDKTKHLASKTKYEATGRGKLPVPSNATAGEIASLRKADQAGLTSVPGIAKGMVTKPLSTMRSAWDQSGTMGKVFAVGDVGLSAPHILDKNTQQGTGEKVLGALGTSGGYLLGGRMGMLGSMAMGSGLGYAGGKVGKLFGGGKSKDGKSGGKKPAPLPPREAVRETIMENAPRVGRLVGPE